ncbi:MAG: PfkB family carbohydrate kinase [Acidobacteriota bacterium]|nr:PfkB family carbohydrate kinase [Acidobacteriota bacterium]
MAEQTETVGRFLSTQPVVLNLPTAIHELPTRGGMIQARSVLSSPGGGFIGLAAVSHMDVETGMLSVLGTGPNSFMIRQELEKHGVKILTDEVIGDIGVAIQLVEDDGNTTVIISSGIEADPPIDRLKTIPLQEGDVLLAHGAALATPEVAQEFAEWIANVDESVTVVVCPSPLVDQIDPSVWPPLLARADVLTLNLREASLLPRILKQLDETKDLTYYLKPDCIQVSRMGALGCEYRVGVGGQRIMVPAFPTEAVDTSGVGDVHVAVMCGSLARGQDIESAILMANAAAAVMISHAYTFPVPTMREIADVMTFGGSNSGAPS